MAMFPYPYLSHRKYSSPNMDSSNAPISSNVLPALDEGLLYNDSIISHNKSNLSNV
jgi:hypothetical protein